MAALDLWSKGLWEYPEFGAPPKLNKVLIEGWLYIRTVWNEGGVWSLDIPAWILTGATALAVPLLLAWIFWPARAPGWDSAGKALILGGAVGNCWDRLNYRGVRDFIDAVFWDWHYPTFNVADAALLVGIGILLVRSFRTPRKETAL